MYVGKKRFLHKNGSELQRVALLQNYKYSQHETVRECWELWFCNSGCQGMVGVVVLQQLEIRFCFSTMELLGVLEPEDVPKESMWYAFAPGGESPSPRVGHTCLYVSDAQGKGKVVIVGGADPGSCFSDAHIINLENCSWKKLTVEGSCPSPRTFHTSSSAIGDKFFVFGGGEKGAEPVADNKLHVFDTTSLTWTQPVTSGDPPKPRHGHIITAVGTKLFIHGGMAGSSFFTDMFYIDTDTMKWVQVKTKGDLPPACAAHSAVSWKKFIYIFGGVTETGPLSTMYRFDTEEQIWAKMKFDSPSPLPRLDHSMCVVPWKIRTDTSAEDHDLGEAIPICLIFGGMDTSGELFNDCYVTALQE
ncbi:rab9 effector protein with kelch motifs isoform X2 [Hyla sarda]|uniref:rab9 effector protein with kelch motifs isoform X2 n=1 Tax=Hyla sarda TaxID=327740 RepID=UPI0024C25E09|nr:rab9 effector protein with kelch motifs isoform X2 [Hyla sarda]